MGVKARPAEFTQSAKMGGKASTAEWPLRLNSVASARKGNTDPVEPKFVRTIRMSAFASREIEEG
jgi:hypothetical protein